MYLASVSEDATAPHPARGWYDAERPFVYMRAGDGRTKRDIIRCLKRFLAREIDQRVMTDFRARQDVTRAA